MLDQPPRNARMQSWQSEGSVSGFPALKTVKNPWSFLFPGFLGEGYRFKV